jgi:hypothetical protein
LTEYLVEVPEKEHEAIRCLPELLITLGGIFDSMGIGPEFAWYILELRMDRLCTGLKGDVDILAGSLHCNDVEAFRRKVRDEQTRLPEAHPSWHEKFAAYESAEAGGIKWPPDITYLIGVEAKCSYLSKDGNLKSRKPLRRRLGEFDTRSTNLKIWG